ncbi:FecCD family ABC transporter permease [Clostridium sp. DL1XJH146]
MNKQNKKLLIIIITILPILSIVISLFIGRYPLSLEEVFRILLNNFTRANYEVQPIPETVVMDVRLPRAILGALVGGSLAISGTALQGMFKNPLVDSGILGVSSGAGFGAALAIILFDSVFMIYTSSFIFSIIAVILTFFIGRIYSTTPNIMLVLGGVVVSSIFSSLISFSKYIADPYDQLPTIVFWLMGSLASADYKDIMIAAIPMLIGVIGLFFIRWRINVLSMGDRECQALGVNTKVTKIIVIICTTLATAGAVSVSGIIGWVGLVIPHIGRMLIGNDNKYLIPISFCLGATFLIFVDNIGRVITGSEIPLGILTALIGGPFYVYLLKKTKGGGW